MTGIEEMKDKEPNMWSVVGRIPKPNPNSVKREESEKSCDVCEEQEHIVLTRHHYTSSERGYRRRKGLSFPKGRAWDWRCANCHMAFNRLGERDFYGEGGYQEKHHVIPSIEVHCAPILVARYTLSTGVLERYDEKKT